MRLTALPNDDLPGGLAPDALRLRDVVSPAFASVLLAAIAAITLAGEARAQEKGRVYVLLDSVYYPGEALMRVDPPRPAGVRAPDYLPRGARIEVETVRGETVRFHFLREGLGRYDAVLRRADRLDTFRYETTVWDPSFSSCAQPVVSYREPGVVAIVDDLFENDGAGRRMLPEVLTAIFRREVALLLTGTGNAKAIGAYATAAVTGPRIDLGFNYPFDAKKPEDAIEWVGGLRLSGAVDDEELVLRGDGARASGLRVGGRLTRYTAGSLFTRRAPREQGLRRRLDSLDALANSVALMPYFAAAQTDTVRRGRREAEAEKRLRQAFIDLMIGAVTREGSRELFRKYYFFGDAEGAVARSRYPFLGVADSGGVVPIDTLPYRAWSLGLGGGVLLRKGTQRFNGEIGVAYQSITTIDRGLARASTLVASVPVQGRGNLDTDERVYRGPFLQDQAVRVEADLIWFPGLPEGNSLWPAVGLRLNPAYVTEGSEAIGVEGDRYEPWAVKAGLLLSFVGKDGKPSVNIFPHWDKRGGEDSFRLSVGIPLVGTM